MDQEKLIDLLIKKDQEGLRILIEDYSGLIYSVITKVLKKFPYLEDEVLNDILLGIWDNIESFNPRRSSFKNWTASVARYKAIDALRREVRHSSQDLDENFQKSDEEALNKIFIREIFSYLDEEDRRLFTALFLEGYSYEEVAKDLGVSKNSLYSRVKRGRKKLKKEFDQGGTYEN